ncbi:MAG: menaquinol oxidoreductase [Candidatus Aminicenantes bacterium]|nr:menaquinol oxidoreductase [Candidatus Aminicenantes bacterium]
MKWLPSVTAALLAVLALIGLFFLVSAVADPHLLFGIVVPYAAIGLFLVGIPYRVLKWARSPVPFHVPTVCGQQKSLAWIPADDLDSPYRTSGVIKRMALEILCFRSLFHNEKFKLNTLKKLQFDSGRLLWFGAIAFHWALLIILLRHLRFFTEPVPGFVNALKSLDGLFQWTWWPGIFITDAVLLAAVTYIFLRRVVLPHLRYISLFTDFFPLWLILGIAATGLGMRLIWKVPLLPVKELAIGLITLDPPAPPAFIGRIFYLHLFLVSVLIAYLPYSKLMHSLGVWLSPTRNLKNNSRMVRHANPWNPAVKVHTYEEYEAEFRARMKKAGLPVDKE